MARKTYRALEKGFISSESRTVEADEVFSADDLPPGKWFEEVTNKEAKADADAKSKTAEELKDAKGS